MYKKHIRELIEELNYYTKLYDEGKPAITDKEWDDLYFKLERMEHEAGYYLPNSPTQKINYEIVSELKKVNHTIPMLSAAKTKDWNEFLKYFSNIDDTKDIIGMLKLDGLSCRLVYKNGELVQASTRGNGVIGEEITHNAKVIASIPQKIPYTEELVVDGEVICRYSDFESFSMEYANPRNFAAGSIRLLSNKECSKRNLTFVLWNVVKGYENENSFLRKLQMMELLGFITTPYTSSFDWDAKEFLEKKAKEEEFPIDGLIGKFDDIEFGLSLGNTSHHQNYLYAFKFYDEEMYTKLLDIDYEVSRNGEMVPVAVFEPVSDGESEISRASLHNLSIMEELSKGFERKGDKLTIIKSNQIIPQIIKWEHNEKYSEENHIFIPEVCSICGQPTEIRISDTGVKSLYCSNDNCQGRAINKFDNFCSRNAMDIRGLSKATLEKLLDWGWIETYLDIYSLKDHRKEWIMKDGFGVKSVDNILEAIEKSKNCDLANFIVALGIPLIGTSQAKEICKEVNTYEDFRNKKSWDKVYSFGEVKNYNIKKFDYTIADKVAKLLNFTQKEVSVSTKTLTKHTICITGKLIKYKNRQELKSIIEDLGGKVVDSVSTKTNILINNDITSTSGKNKKAKELNILIITEEEFINNYLT